MTQWSRNMSHSLACLEQALIQLRARLANAVVASRYLSSQACTASNTPSGKTTADYGTQPPNPPSNTGGTIVKTAPEPSNAIWRFSAYYSKQTLWDNIISSVNNLVQQHSGSCKEEYHCITISGNNNSIRFTFNCESSPTGSKPSSDIP